MPFLSVAGSVAAIAAQVLPGDGTGRGFEDESDRSWLLEAGVIDCDFASHVIRHFSMSHGAMML